MGSVDSSKHEKDPVVQGVRSDGPTLQLYDRLIDHPTLLSNIESAWIECCQTVFIQYKYNGD